jgi:chemotaxis protein CheX
MRADFVNPFLRAADEVLESELGEAPKRGQISVRKSAYTTDHVSAVVAVTGTVSGMVIYSMSEPTACGIVEHVLGSPCPQFNTLAQSGIGELGNVITGRAATLLAEAGFPSNLLPPRLITGSGVLVSKVDQQRLIIPLITPRGRVEIQVVLSEAARLARAA